MVKYILTVFLVITVVVVGVFLFSQNKNEEVAYGKFSNYFTGQESIAYPLIFDDIKIIKTDRLSSINFGPQEMDIFDFFMSVNKVTRKESINSKLDMIERGWILEGEKNTKNGYVGEILSNDPKIHPVPNMKSCSFGYIYSVPLGMSDNNLVLLISVSQLDWGKDGNYSNCQIFKDKNYNYLKSIMNNVIDNLQPAF